ncbi:MAG: alkane 1-monooxygenase [Phaeodactylibacter sp.]|nr:alkane 1-monooxygenase [Phaeodactylibacter sp.]MCB9051131.1 alkane 1-monooxygenase [Lewinellaceae bacterium]
MGKIKYFGAYIIPLLALLTFNTTGIYAYFGLIFLYVLVPILEMIIPPDTHNLAETEKELAREDLFYDLALYLLVPLHLFVIYAFLNTIADAALTTSVLIARIFMMGTILGVIGINVGHELGHKTSHPLKQVLAQVLLTTSVQNHFVPYHNGGHHKDVATPADLTSARKGDNYYLFALRSQIGGYFKTWGLEAKRLRAQGKNPAWNPMILYTLLPILLLLGIYYFFGVFATACYFLASVYGIAILEAQNYFAHYGLRRKMRPDGRYERVNAQHSWNSDHIIGRVLLFELTRHSDHHHMGAKPYQVLESREESPMLPYGYPMMLILSFFPFLFRPIMDKQLKLYGME